MKHKLLLGAAAAALLFTSNVGVTPSGEFHATAVPPPAAAEYGAYVDFNFFYGNLRDHGRWIHRDPYGWIFIPAVNAGWRPYEAGYWEYDDYYGWVWISEENFGWATYHYGSWDYDSDYGWYWVPGYEWGPSWVVWRTGDDYVGWAPVLASVIWGLSYNDLFYDRWYDHDHYRRNDYWRFTRTGDFGDGRRSRLIPVTETNIYIDNSTTIYNTTIVDNTIVARGPDIADVERRAGRRMERVSIRETDDVEGLAQGGGVVRPRAREGITTEERIADRVRERAPQARSDGQPETAPERERVDRTPETPDTPRGQSEEPKPERERGERRTETPDAPAEQTEEPKPERERGERRTDTPDAPAEQTEEPKPERERVERTPDTPRERTEEPKPERERVDRTPDEPKPESDDDRKEREERERKERERGN